MIVHVGGFDYEIVFKDELDGDDMGEFHERSERISISNRQSLNNQKSTVVHEVIHAISSIYNLDIDETQTRKYEQIIFAWLKNNKEVIQWIIEDEKP